MYLTAIVLNLKRLMKLLTGVQFRGDAKAAAKAQGKVRRLNGKGEDPTPRNVSQARQRASKGALRPPKGTHSAKNDPMSHPFQAKAPLFHSL